MTEVDTDIGLKEFIAINYPWYGENSCFDSPQADTPLSSSEPGDKLSSWAMVGHLHVNNGDPIAIVLVPYTNEKTPQINRVDSLTNRLENFIGEKFFEIPDVEYVFVTLEKASINIWTVINRLNREVREEIYDIEYDILDFLKDYYFDFHVICRDDRNIEELYPSNVKMIFQK